MEGILLGDDFDALEIMAPLGDAGEEVEGDQIVEYDVHSFGMGFVLCEEMHVTGV